MPRAKKLPPNIVLRGDSYQIRLMVDGKLHRESCKTLDEARIRLGRVREEAMRGRLGMAKNSRWTLKDWSPRYLEWARLHKKSYVRDEWCMKQLIDAFGQLRLQDVTIQRVDAFMKNRRLEVAPATVNRQVALLKKVLSHAVECRELEVNPLKGLKLFRESADRVPVVEKVDERRLLEACKPWLRWVIQLAVGTGCRQGELLSLRWRHIDFDNEVLVVETSKSGESRRVPLHPVILEELRRRRGTPEGYVVQRPDGEVPSQQSISRGFKKAARSVGRGDLRFHDLRHVAASRFLATGANLPEVADLLGHKTLVMAKRYAHTNPNRMKELVSRMAVNTPDGQD